MTLPVRMRDSSEEIRFFFAFYQNQNSQPLSHIILPDAQTLYFC